MKRPPLALIIILVAALAYLTSGCTPRSNESQPETPQTKKQLKVYTTIYPLYDFARNIGGERVSVINMVPPGIEPHEYEPSPKDIAAVERGGVFIYCGAGMESWAQRVEKTLKERGVIVVDGSKGIELLDIDGEPVKPDHSITMHSDPHIWLDPLRAVQIVENIKEGFCLADPQGKDYYETNASNHKEELINLHKEYQKALSSPPKRSFVTSHAAFGYLANRYGLKQIPLRGISPEAEPSPGRMAEVINKMREEKLDYVFIETTVSPKVSEIIASETGAKILVLNPLGNLTKDEIAAGKNYFSAMRENLEALKTALGVKNGE